MNALADMATSFGSRRLYMVQPSQVGVTINGQETIVPGTYLAAGIAGMCGAQKPSQPFSNLPIIGYTRPVGSSDLYSETMMASAAAGGVYWVVQDSQGAPLVCRHQLSTDMTSLKTQFTN